MSVDLFKYKQFDICQANAAMKVGTDSDLLGTLATGGSHILDIGTGTGVISLMMAQRFPEASIEAVEIDDKAILDARTNFEGSSFAKRLTLHHASFQDYLTTAEDESFDCVVCNPPYFDRSTECPDNGRTRARHTSSLPFSTLIQGAFKLLKPDGVFSVCIPAEVLSTFKAECILSGFSLKAEYRIKTIPRKDARRFVLVHQKGFVDNPIEETHCMRNADSSRSDWYKGLMKDFLVSKEMNE